MKKAALDALLGPVDLGPEEEWVHIGWEPGLVALCGEQCTVNLGPCGKPPYGRVCPDCERIYGMEL